MRQEIRSRISLADRPSIGKQIIALQSAISYAEAIAQVQRLKETSKVGCTLKKSRLNDQVTT